MDPRRGCIGDKVGWSCGIGHGFCQLIRDAGDIVVSEQWDWQYFVEICDNVVLGGTLILLERLVPV